MTFQFSLGCQRVVDVRYWSATWLDTSTTWQHVETPSLPQLLPLPMVRERTAGLVTIPISNAILLAFTNMNHCIKVLLLTQTQGVRQFFWVHSCPLQHTVSVYFLKQCTRRAFDGTVSSQIAFHEYYWNETKKLLERMKEQCSHPVRGYFYLMLRE